MTTQLPSNLHFTKEHEWARKDGDLVVIGITQHAVDQLGDITLVTLPEPGTALERGQSFGDIDSVKAVSELYAPISGEIVERNTALDEAPETVNGSPYDEGWMVKLRPSDPSQLDGLLDANAYQAYLDEIG